MAVQPDGKIVVVGPTNAGQTVQTKGDVEFGVARYNADGTLDQGFGVGGPEGDGLVATNFDDNIDGTGTDDTPTGVALQSDGKIVVAGRTDPAGADQGDFAVARYNADGTPDTDFGGDGLVTTDFGGANGDSASGVAIEGTPGSPDFRIVAAGTKTVSFSNQIVAVAAYGDDGTLDSGFSGDGMQTTDLTSVYPTAGVALQPDGKVLVAATAGDFFPPGPVDFALVRYDTTGSPDGTFGGGDGIVKTDFAGGYDQAGAVAVQDLGSGQVRIAVGGRASPDASTTDDGGVAVFTTDGSLDPTFAPGGGDGDGRLTFDMQSNNSFDAMRGIAFQPDGKLVGAGSVGTGDFGVVRLTSAGSLDPSFGTGGLASTTFPNSNQPTANGLALQSDGRIVAAGGELNPSNGSDFLVARYLPDAAPNPPSTTPPSQPAQPKKKCKKKKKHRAAAAKKKCKKKKSK